MQMGTQKEQMKRVIPWLVTWASHTVARDFFPTLSVLVNHQYKIFYTNCTLLQFTVFVSIAQQAGQAIAPRCLSLNMRLCCAHLADDPDRVSNAEAKAIEIWS
jgi:hypothetical protein